MDMLRERLLALANTAVRVPHADRHFGDFVVEPLPPRVEGTLTFRRDYTPTRDAAAPLPSTAAVGARGADSSDDETDNDDDDAGASNAPAAWARRRDASASAFEVIPRDLLVRVDVGVDATALLARLRDGSAPAHLQSRAVFTPEESAAAAATSELDTDEGDALESDADEDTLAASQPQPPVVIPVTVEDIWQAEREHDVEARVIHLALPGRQRQPDMQLQLASQMPIVSGADAVAEFIDRNAQYRLNKLGMPRLALRATTLVIPPTSPAAAGGVDAVAAAASDAATAAQTHRHFRVHAPPGQYSVRNHTLDVIEEYGRQHQHTALASHADTPLLHAFCDATQVPALADRVDPPCAPLPERLAVWHSEHVVVAARRRRERGLFPPGTAALRALCTRKEIVLIGSPLFVCLVCVHAGGIPPPAGRLSLERVCTLATGHRSEPLGVGSVCRAKHRHRGSRAGGCGAGLATETARIDR